MKRFLILLLLAIPCSGQMLQSIVSGGAPLAATVNCGTTTQAATDSNASINVANPCVVGANAGGYSVVNIKIYHATGAGTLYGALYTDDGGAPGSPQTLLCSGSLVVGATDNAFVTIPISGCGTIAANKQIWIAINPTDATVIVGAVSSTCTPVRGVFHQPGTNGTWPGTWSTSSTYTGSCWSQYVVLQPL